jgi:hypothetical protein
VRASGCGYARGSVWRLEGAVETGRLDYPFRFPQTDLERGKPRQALLLARPRFDLHPEAVAHLLDYLFVEGLPLVTRPLPAALPDLTDQPSWEVAAEAAAPLITGNLKHFPTEVCTGIEVLAPATFIERWH